MSSLSLVTPLTHKNDLHPTHKTCLFSSRIYVQLRSRTSSSGIQASLIINVSLQTQGSRKATPDRANGDKTFFAVSFSHLLPCKALFLLYWTARN